MYSFLNVISIDKFGTHYLCPECQSVLLCMTGGHVVVVSVSLLDEIDSAELPMDFEPVSLPLRMCRECRVEVALMEAEGVLP